MSSPQAERPTQGSPPRFEITLPDGASGVDQDEEWCEVRLDGRARRIRFHDYDEIYSVPGLYEQLFYDELGCQSPRTIRDLLAEELEAESVDPADLTVLDVGAGNGMVGEQLSDLGVGSQVAVDIIEEAKLAAERDRPDVYDDYVVADLTDLPPDVHRRLEQRGFNCLTTVAALGFGDIPPRAFSEAFNLVRRGGFVAFNIKEGFLDDGDGTGFARLIRRMVEEGALELRAQRRYRHRLSMTGEPLYYVAIVALKRAHVPDEWVTELED